jgi:hypothetical protein
MKTKDFNIEPNYQVICLIKIDGIIFGRSSSKLDLRIIHAKFVKSEFASNNGTARNIEAVPYFNDAVSVSQSIYTNNHNDQKNGQISRSLTETLRKEKTFKDEHRKEKKIKNDDPLMKEQYMGVNIPETAPEVVQVKEVFPETSQVKEDVPEVIQVNEFVPEAVKVNEVVPEIVPEAATEAVPEVVPEVIQPVKELDIDSLRYNFMTASIKNDTEYMKKNITHIDKSLYDDDIKDSTESSEIDGLDDYELE